MEESNRIILVDVEDRERGSAEKLEAHEKGLLHRAFSIFIHDGDKMLIQQRAPGKYHSGGLWTNTCCSHPRVGEQLDAACHARLRDEMGFDAELHELFSFTYRTPFPDGLTEYEYDHVFLGSYRESLPVIPNPEEASAIQWIPLDALKRALTLQPQMFTSWFLIAAPKVILSIENA